MITNDNNVRPFFDLPKTAILKADPEDGSFSFEDYILCWTVKVINHTNLDIKFNYCGDICIKNCYRGITENSCKLVFYRLKNLPNIICYDKQLSVNNEKSRFFLDISQDKSIFQCDTEHKIHKMSEETPKIDIFAQILFGMKEEKSILNQIPEDIFKQFVHQYDRCIQSDIDQLLLEDTSIANKEQLRVNNLRLWRSNQLKLKINGFIK